MTLETPWPDGGVIPERFTQAGPETSPALRWTGAPDGVVTFAVLMHDLDAPTAGGSDDVLHWLVWNIPAAATGLAEGQPQGPELPDGSRQISATGPYYRGPAAPASGPEHHYLIEVFALDARVEVPAVGASPAATRSSVEAAMAGHVRAKATAVGRYRRMN
ncbi:MAG: YbhB/YbcL family Raf kinase inhibitor-like protein [Vicinamibacterales bacterium]